MYEVQEAFERQKDEEKRLEEKFRQQEQELRARDLFIQQNLISFNKYLQENEAKKARAEKRLEEEERQKKRRQQEIQALEDHLADLEKKSCDLEGKVN